MPTLAVRTLEAKIRTLRASLTSSLIDLEIKVKRAQESLQSGEDLDPRMLSNSFHIDALVAQYNTLRELSEVVQGDQAEAVAAFSKSLCEK